MVLVKGYFLKWEVVVNLDDIFINFYEKKWWGLNYINILKF